MTPSRRGFSLVQLLVVIGIVAMVFTYLLLFRERTTYGNRGIRCQSNLSQIGKALVLYSNENNGYFPRTFAADGAPVQLTNDGFDSPTPDAKPIAPGRTNNLPQAMWLLITNEDLTPSVFICPSGTAMADTMGGQPATSRSNFTGDGLPGGRVQPNLSYSFVNVYPSAAAQNRGYSMKITYFSSDFAIAADLSPMAISDPRWAACVVGAPRGVMATCNSDNHHGDGQNVLYADGHAEFQQTPLCGANNDNIFTAQDTSAGTNHDRSIASDDPQTATDSVLLIHSP